jgi:hypothetical protein
MVGGASAIRALPALHVDDAVDRGHRAPAVVQRILECLKLPARAPPLGGAIAEPEERERAEGDWSFDQAPTHEEA